MACRWRRRWQWGAGTSRTHDSADMSTAPVDIEQPAAASHEAGASSSGSHTVLDRTAAGSAEQSSTPMNFPGMHYSRFAPSGEASDVSKTAAVNSLVSKGCFQTVHAYVRVHCTDQIKFLSGHKEPDSKQCSCMQSSVDESGITPVEASQSLSAQHSQDVVVTPSSLPAVRTSHVRRPGRARLSGSLPARAQAPLQPIEPSHEPEPPLQQQ